jgi:hypothetical protein
MNNLKVGDFGHFTFTVQKRVKNMNYDTVFDIEGVTVVQVNETEILLKGSDDIHYVVSKNRIKMFEEMEHTNK